MKIHPVLLSLCSVTISGFPQRLKRLFRPRRLVANSCPFHSTHDIGVLRTQHLYGESLRRRPITVLEYVFIDCGGKTGTACLVSRGRIVRVAGIHLQQTLAAWLLRAESLRFPRHTISGSTSMLFIVLHIVLSVLGVTKPGCLNVCAGEHRKL
jgi:hypothetical protein